LTILLSGFADCLSEADQLLGSFGIHIGSREDVLYRNVTKLSKTFCGAVDAIAVFERDFGIEVEEGGGESVEHDLTPFSMSMVLEYQV
jgi:hypothetical protein